MKQQERDKLVSVVVATYNGEKYLGELLDSILEQSYPVYEILIKDDGSTDSTCQIAETYCRNHGNIRLIRNERNMGISDNFLTGFLTAKGEFVAYADQDDIWEKNKIERLLAAMGDGNLAFSNSAVCDEKGNFLYPLIQKRVFVSEIISFLDMTIWGHQILFRKSILENLPIMELSATVWLDSLLADIAFKGDNRNVVYVNEMLIRWRRHRSASSFGAYNQKSRTVDLRYTGVLDALRASADKERCRRVRLYFSALKRIDGISPDCRRVIGWMAECSFTSLLKAGALCLRNYTDSFPGTLSFPEKIRIFLKPFFAVRNQSKGIERIP